MAIGGVLVAPALANVLVDGDFDTGALAPWVGWNGGAWMGPPGVADATDGVWNPGSNTSGGFSSRGSFGANMVGGNTGIYQEVAVTPGQTYTLEFDVAGGVGGFGDFNGVAWWEVRYMDQAWDIGQIDNGPLLWKREEILEGGFGWTHGSAQFTPTSPTIAIYTKFGGWDPEWNYAYFGAYYDTFNLTPEPASLLLLGLGLPLLCRRR
jgi:hypothetical protein